MVLVAPPSWRPTLRQGERAPCGPTPLVAPPSRRLTAAPGRACALRANTPAGQRPAAKRDARATNGSENAEA
ncbi:MAG TPA: hypothetical protein VH599_15735 [Ktedonobacterales bacterium]